MEQREMVLLASVQKPKLVEASLVTACKDELAAVHLCIQLSGYDQEDVREALGISKGHFTRMMQGTAHFPTRKRKALMRICKNFAPLQYEAQALGFSLIERPDEQIAELERKLAVLQQQQRGAA